MPNDEEEHTVLSESKNQNFMKGAAILAAAQILSKIVSAIYKIPLLNILDNEGSTYFTIAYNVYTLLLAISTVGIPVALSRQISAASATGRSRLAKKYYRVALPTFAVIGAVLMVLMFVFSDQLARMMNFELASTGIKVLAPAVFFACIVSVMRGYTQGRGNMLPTAVSQLIEVLSKSVFGLAVVYVLAHTGRQVHIISAGAIVGIPIGLALSIPVLIFFKRRIDRTNRIETYGDGDPLPGSRDIMATILKVSAPIALGSAFISVLSLIDSKVVTSQLINKLGYDSVGAADQYGVYAKGLTLFNLPSALIAPISVSIVPAISAAVARSRNREAGRIMQSSIRITNLLAMPCAVGLSVLAEPIFKALYWGDGADSGAVILTFLGLASYFVCMQLVSTAILQANGYERVPMFTFVMGGAIQIALDYILVGNPSIGILGSPVGTLACYTTITVLNLLFVTMKVKERPKLTTAFIKPLLCTAVMGVSARVFYELIARVVSRFAGDGRIATVLSLGGAIFIAVIVYAILVFATKAITREDVLMLPKGEKLADKLRLK